MILASPDLQARVRIETESRNPSWTVQVIRQGQGEVLELSGSQAPTGTRVSNFVRFCGLRSPGHDSLLRPCFLILLYSVTRSIPSNLALREMFQPVWSKTA